MKKKRAVPAQKHTVAKPKATRKSKSESDADRGLYLRFEDAPSKEKVRKAAKAAGVSMNRYIVAASTAWAKDGKRLEPIAMASKQPASLAS